MHLPRVAYPRRDVRFPHPSILTPVAQPRKEGSLIHQLRIYEIFEQNKGAFHERFRDHASRIMKSYGFDIMAMWESRTGDKTEFVYLLSWPDQRTMIDAWEKFKADEEWKNIKKVTSAKHGDLVGLIQDRTLQPTDYSPKLPHAESSQRATKKTGKRGR